MAGTILVCYDVETASDNTLGFLDGAVPMHEEMDIPCTMSLTGETIEACTAACKAAGQHPLVCSAQHTYSHVLLKTVYMQPGDGKPCSHSADGSDTFLIEAGDLETIEQELSRTQQIFLDTFGHPCRGLTAPWGAYRGLMDRPDLLRILDKVGLKWVRSYARDHRDCQPTPFDVQAFFYADQGLPDLLEIPIQGYQDDFYWERFDDRAHGPDYTDYLSWAVEHVVANDLIWCLNSHDHGTPTAEAFENTKGVWLRDVLTKAKSAGVRFVTCEAFYREQLAARDG